MASMILHTIILRRNIHLAFFLLALGFLFMSSRFQFRAQGRQFPWLPDDANLRKMDEVKKRWLLGIGSRPPRCEKRCSNCGHCEAVQVPIQFFYGTHNSRGDGISNYKPIFWKCKCGNFIFNP